MENKWEIPILCSSDGVRHDKDKKGARSLVIDCVINDRMMRWCELNKDLKLILIEWCFEAVEFKEDQSQVEVGINIRSGGTVGVSSSSLSLIIDRDVMVVPKRTYMGGDGYPPDMEVDLGALQMESDEIHEAVKSIAEEAKSENGEQEQSGESTIDLLAKLKQGGSNNQEEKKVKKPIIEEIDEFEVKKIKEKSEERTKLKTIGKSSTITKAKTGSEAKRKSVIEKELSEKYKGKKLLMKIGVDVEVAEDDQVEVAVNWKRSVAKLSYGKGGAGKFRSVEVALPQGEEGDDADASSPKGKMCGVFVRNEKSLYVFT
ncbi:unnamed protein product [Ambrosiozyma monospora]|uniref:Unnamed protein product n=1 Tax=Ambrosiozyma monospora TaxID=43982 RepID=A0A9W7DG27_AMBMO|nr:unnamed protein product [Ambrosiozyma monospora]